MNQVLSIMGVVAFGAFLAVLVLAVTGELREIALDCQKAAWERRRGRGRVATVEERLARRSLASSLARHALASSPQAYHRVRHHDRWGRSLAELAARHTSCSDSCFQQAASYCRSYPNSGVALAFPLLDPPDPLADRLPGRVVSQCSSASLRRRCHYACRCDKSDEICPNGDHLQISAARPGEPVDSPLPTEKTREVLLPFSVMGETLLGAEWARVDRQQGQRGHHTLVGLRGTGRTGYRYNWLR